MTQRDGDAAARNLTKLRALTELSDADLAATLGNLGGRPFQARQVSHWVWKHGVESFDQIGMTASSKVQKNKLAAHARQLFGLEAVA